MRAREAERLASRQSSRTQAGQAAQVISSQGELRQSGLGGRRPPQMARAFPESQAGAQEAGLPAHVGGTEARGEQDRAGTQDRGVPSRHFTHCNSFSRRLQERLRPGVLRPEPEPRGPERERRQRSARATAAGHHLGGGGRRDRPGEIPAAGRLRGPSPRRLAPCGTAARGPRGRAPVHSGTLGTLDPNRGPLGRA